MSSKAKGDRNSAGTIPRAVIHKKILDEAGASPDASIDEIAARISAATPELVERVFEEYGDPVEVSKESDMSENMGAENLTMNGASQSEHEDSMQDAPALDLEALTEKKRQTLEAIAENPEATQAEIADQFGVTSASICIRLNEIDGFDWSNRREFVEDVFGVGNVSSNGDGYTKSGDLRSNSHEDLKRELKALADHVETLEKQITDRPAQPTTPFANPDLAAKVIHGCMNSAQIAEDEKLEITKFIISAVRSCDAN